MKQLVLQMRLRERARFETFLPGPNQAILAHLRGIAEGSERALCWLCGPTGSGKTHLLQAACARCAGDTGNAAPVEEGGGRASAAYLPLESLQTLGPGVLEGWQGTSLLALDGLEAVAGQRDWELALFRVYREVEERGASLVLAARERPQRLPFVLTDLSSRFASAVVWSLTALDEPKQRAALRAQAQARGLQLTEQALGYLQRRCRRDLSSLTAVLDQLDEAALGARRRLTVPFIREVLGASRQGPPA